MSAMDEKEVEALRREIGQKMALDNEGVPGEHSSESLKEGYRRAASGWGSNVMPRNFGRTGNAPADWECICGHLNKGTVRRKVGGRVVCWMCGIEQELALIAKNTPDVEVEDEAGT